MLGTEEYRSEGNVASIDSQQSQIFISNLYIG